MRVILYGAASVAVLAACAEMAQAARARPVWRNERFFKPEETEPCEAVVCLDGAERSEAIAQAYAAKGVPVFVVPPEGSEGSDDVIVFGEFLTSGTPLSASARSGAVPLQDAAIADLRSRIATLEEQLGNEQWMHAACLSIAEGAPGWDGEKAMESEAMRAVQRLRASCDEQAATIAAHAEQLEAKDAVIAEQAAAIAALEAQIAAASTEPQGDAAPPTGDTPPADATTPTAPATRTRSRSK